MKYRAEIDGLRAIAVISVIFFHSGLGVLKGGYLGVDIFFVISGYLITLILLDSFANKKFSFFLFYEKRARRILPALYVVLLITYILFWFIFDPFKFKIFSQSIFATSTFTSNIYFWLKNDYFSPTSENIPLIHTWSLSVEEQFYLFVPAILFTLWKIDKEKIFLYFIFFLIISFLSSIFLIQNPQTNFYLIFSRMWELFFGCIAALIFKKFKFKKNNFFTLVGLILIIYSLFFFDQSTILPSYYTLLPVLGVFLIIVFGGKNDYVSQFLSLKIFVFIGLISYSAYLWHQPILVFSRNFFQENSSQFVLHAAIFFNFFLAFITWKFVENPFRNRNFISRKKFVIIFLTLTFSISSIGFAGHIYMGKNSFSYLKLDEKLRPIINNAFNDVVNLHGYSCHDKFNYQKTLDYICEYDFSNKEKLKSTIIVWGDSHVHSYSDLFIDLAKKNKTKLLISSLGSCPPIIDIYQYSIRDNFKCYSFNSSIANYVKNLNNAKIFLVARWSSYTSKKIERDKGMEDRFISCKKTDFERNKLSSKLCLENGLIKLIEIIKKNNNSLYIISQAPTFKSFSKEKLFKIKNVDELQSVSYSDYLDQNRDMSEIISKIKFNNYLDLWNLICGEYNCKVIQNNHLMYWDHNHISPYLARRMIDDFNKLFKSKNR